MTITMTESQIEGILFLLLLIAGVIVAAMIPILDYLERKRRDRPQYPAIAPFTQINHPTYEFEKRLSQQRELAADLLAAARRNAEDAVEKLRESRNK